MPRKQQKLKQDQNSGIWHVQALGKKNLMIMLGDSNNNCVQGLVPGQTGVTGPIKISGANQDVKNLPRDRIQKVPRAKL